MFQDGETVDFNGVKVLYECSGPLAGECSILIPKDGGKERKIVKASELKTIEAEKK